MRGIIFNVVEETISAEHGMHTWDALLASADLPGGYSSMGDYPDEELDRLIEVGSAALGTTPRDLTRHFGQSALLALSDRYPQFFAPHACTRDFLLTLNEVIHPEVRKLHPHANPPEFDFSEAPNGDLVVGYHSTRRLCAFADGMIVGAGLYFRETVVVRHAKCTADGDEICVLHCSFLAQEEGDLADVSG